MTIIACGCTSSPVTGCCRRRIITEPLHATLSGTINAIVQEPIFPFSGYFNEVAKSCTGGLSFEMGQTVSPPGVRPFAFALDPTTNFYQDGRTGIFGYALPDRSSMICSFTRSAINFVGDPYTAIDRYYFGGLEVGCADSVMAGLMHLVATSSHYPDGLGGPEDESPANIAMSNSTAAPNATFDLISCNPLHITGTFFLAGSGPSSGVFGFEITE